MTDTTILDVLTPASDVDFSLPQLNEQIWAFPPNYLCSYLVALAAIQRGLDVTFHGDPRNSRHLGRGTSQASEHPQFCIVSAGSRSILFDQSAGSLTNLAAARLTKNKSLTKKTLALHGIQSPRGTLASGKTIASLEQFLNRSGASRFVIKPNDGSLGKGMVKGLSPQDVIAHVTKQGDKPVLVEEQIFGPEYRVYVVADKVAAAYEKPGVYVIGNGKSTIAQLIAERNTKRSANVYLRKSPIDPAHALEHLGRMGMQILSIPAFGQRVSLRDSHNLSSGGAARECTSALPVSVALASIAACKACGLPNGGVDVIDTPSGPYILELNSRAHIGGHSFPSEGTGRGNAVAEAIVDFYFPAAQITRDPALIVNTAPIVEAFRKDGQKTEVQAQTLRA